LALKISSVSIPELPRIKTVLAKLFCSILPKYDLLH
jgi:hypothetical protein